MPRSVRCSRRRPGASASQPRRRRLHRPHRRTRIMLGSCWAIVVAGVWLMFAHGFWMLMLGQLAGWCCRGPRSGLRPGRWRASCRGRAASSWDASTQRPTWARFAGTALGGISPRRSGIPAHFPRPGGHRADGLSWRAWAPSRPRQSLPLGHNLLLGYWRLLHQRIIQYSMLCAYLSALPFSLSISFYPLLLADFGYGEGASGILLALRAFARSPPG